ncbi:5-(carboxyamino)imidazole ribonucleotide synthase [Anaerosacchariphilus polymeriproducens]|uniref:N5-carboxyaminoimidazole ribonucleotide synthase n=1 Tax=Anaerosacchariphilus polymeriproducens TaxID=1812858 RepID=A0A371AWZ9_9FIRM|nr:5-(carboxyamino)imidazole ribonucleotide synthase [Anaerosacchariphilus polymeriproducens]RDU24114.1 5-(carboxyamino)imidazole ribonucleotide synthase [Anaerosacchariphilus polymeriproducens]
MHDFISKKVGIIGGGQLGKMLVSEAAKMGIYTVILDPDEDSVAASLANEKIVASFDNHAALLKIANRTDILTCEFEHISTEALKYLENKGFTVYPTAEKLETIQNKFNQKTKLRKHGIPVGDYLKADGIEGIKDAVKIFDYPVVLKTSTGAYDGKGNSIIKCEEDIEKAFMELGGNADSIYVEKFIPFVKEISILCCGDMNGELVIYPIAENIHKNSILYDTSVPAMINESQTIKAIEIAKKVYNIFGSVGMLCVEMFLTTNGELLVNEIAPRPHNSGHYTIEGCITSQFENHIRAVVGLPLGRTDLIMPTVMRNILGENGYKGVPVVEGAYKVLAIDGLKLHIYGKKETKPNRKMGHLTITAPTLDKAREKADRACKIIRIISK